MTLTEFLAWNPPDLAGMSWQLVDGEPVAMAPGSETHAALQGEIGALIRNHLLDKDLPCRLLSQPGLVPRIRSDRNFRIPDLGVTCAAPSHDLMARDPVLLIEILSPSNEAQTRANIWTYTTIPSVRETLAVHSTRIEAELLRRGAEGNWPEQPDTLTGNDAVVPDTIGYSVPLSAFYRTSVRAA